MMRVGKNSCPVLSHLWTKVHEFIGQRRRPFVLSNAFADFLCHVSFTRYSLLSLKVVEKPNKWKSFWPPIFFRERQPQIFCDRLLARPTVRRLPKCGWVSFADLCLQSLEIKWNADFFAEGGWKLTSNLKPFVDQRACRFETMYQTPCNCQRTWPIVYVVCLSEDIGC